MSSSIGGGQTGAGPGSKGCVWPGLGSHHKTLKPLLRPVNRPAGAPAPLASWTSCPFHISSSSPSFFSLSSLPVLSPYQPQHPFLPFSGSISPAIFKVPHPLPSRMRRLATITLPVPSSFSVVNPKAAFHSRRPTCASCLPFLLFPLLHASIAFPPVSTSTPSSGPLLPLKAQRQPRHHLQEVLPSGAVISPQASMSFSLLSPDRPTSYRHPTPSRSGHVIIGGMGADGRPLSDIWVRPTNTLAVTQPRLTTILRNMTTTTNFGPRSIRHQTSLRPPSKVQ